VRRVIWNDLMFMMMCDGFGWVGCSLDVYVLFDKPGRIPGRNVG